MMKTTAGRLIDRLATHTPDGRPYRFAFVCGHMRSGTSWVQNILRCHPEIAVYAEGPFGHVCTVIEEVKRLPWLYTSNDPGVHQVLDESFAEMVRHCMLQLATRDPEKSWIADSTSRQIWPYLPGTHHIHITRDARDVLTSWTLHQLANGLLVGEPWKTRLSVQAAKLAEDPDYFTKHPHELLSDEAWVRHICRGWWQFMYTAAEVRAGVQSGSMNLRLLDLRYEQLHEDAQGQAEVVYRFLGLDPSAAQPISLHNGAAAGFTLGDARQHYRSGKVRDWEKYAHDDLRRWVKDAIGDTLIETGYERDLNW
jgi:Sulfotransferase domain